MPARLFCKTGDLAGSDFPIGMEAGIGSDPANQIVLSIPIISGNHARIFYSEKDGCYFLEDRNSRNGTKLDGMTVSQKEKLGRLHVITFADSHDFIFQEFQKPVLEPPALLKPADHSSGTVSDKELPSLPANFAEKRSGSGTKVDSELPEIPPLQSAEKLPFSRTAADTDLPPVPPSLGSKRPVTVADAELPVIPSLEKQKSKTMAETDLPPIPQELARQAAPENYRLQVQLDNKVFQLNEGENIVGRGNENPICIKHPTVSRKHAMITRQAGRITLKDLNSANHTFVDGQTIQSEVEITAASRIRFGVVEAWLIAV
jgi:pSer/pThr/pTyr-binding forkhead associated (FHA) protein